MSARAKNILAIETATSRGSVALASGGEVLESVCIGERAEHSLTLIPHVEQLLRAHSLKVKDIGLISVSQGPGSFTGIRVGIACAKGLAMGLDIPIVAIPTFDVLLAGQRRDPLSPLADDVKRIALLIDAKKDEFFLQFLKRGKTGGWKAEAPAVIPTGAVPAQVSTLRSGRTLLVSPQISKLRGILSNASEDEISWGHIAWDIKDRFPDAADVALLGWKKFQARKKGDADVRPFYLRKTDAELLFKNKPRVFRWERPAHA